uniref:Uncharacterized protein n=1 Tax=Timema poppense TaxID=170557 RepID=A0A7R9CL89_TIMPO|nr:unnamed protein product [Timema poppensis]
MQQSDVKPCYPSLGYGNPSSSNSAASSKETPKSSTPAQDFVHSPYYPGGGSKMVSSSLKQPKTPDSMDNHGGQSSGKVVPKTEMTGGGSCCSSSTPSIRTDLMVPKIEAANNGPGGGGNTCKACTPPPSPMRQTAFDPSSYLNQDSNSSSVSSMDTMGSRSMVGGPPPNQVTPHHHLQPSHHIVPPPPPPYSAMGLSEDPRSLPHQMPQRSPYDGNPTMVATSSEDMYHRADHAARQYAGINPGANIARPIVSYSTYDSTVPGHRPYDPGTASVYERYDAAPPPSCNPLQQPQRPAPPPSMYSYSSEQHEQQVREYHQEAAQQHQMAVAAAASMAAASAGMMKNEGSSESDASTGPLYPRPMYHYDPTTGVVPPGFPSAINLSVKCVAAAQAAQAQIKGSKPTSPGGSVMDLSTSSVTSTSPQVGDNTLDSPPQVLDTPECRAPQYGSNSLSPHYGGSPQAAASPHLSSSPQVPSPQGQTLDLSVNRVPPTGSPSPMYPGEAVPAFIGPRSIEEQTEPVDFSTANEPVNFSGVRQVAGFTAAPGGGYSRESTPDSGGSHYLDTYRDANGMLMVSTGSHYSDAYRDANGIGKVEYRGSEPAFAWRHSGKLSRKNHPPVHPTEIRTSISPSSAVELNTTIAYHLYLLSIPTLLHSVFYLQVSLIPAQYSHLVTLCVLPPGYAPMSPHLGYAMSGVQSEYPAGTYTPYPTGGYPCGGGGGYPATGYPSAPVSSGYSPGPCYSTMPPPQHAPPQPLDKPLGPKDDGTYIARNGSRQSSFSFARPAPRGRDGKELIQCPTHGCDGMGHVSGNYATHRRQASISNLYHSSTWVVPLPR